MMNVKHFSFHHNDLGLFFVSVLHLLYYRQYKHKCVVKYLRILFFILRTHKYTVKFYSILFFLQKQCTQCTSHSQPTQSCTYTTYKTTEEFTVYSYSKKEKKKPMLHPLFCCGLATAPHPHHKQCFPWPSSGVNIA